MKTLKWAVNVAIFVFFMFFATLNDDFSGRQLFIPIMVQIDVIPAPY